MLQYRRQPQQTGLKPINERPIQFLAKIVTAFVIAVVMIGISYLGIRFLMFSFWDSVIFVVIAPVFFYLIITKRRIIEETVQIAVNTFKNLGAKVEVINNKRANITPKVDFEKDLIESLDPKGQSVSARTNTSSKNEKATAQEVQSVFDSSSLYLKFLYYSEILRPYLKYFFGDNKSQPNDTQQNINNTSNSGNTDKQPDQSRPPKIKLPTQPLRLDEPKIEVWTVEDIPLKTKDKNQKQNRQPYGWKQD